MSSTPFTGSLVAKRKTDLVEIAQALGIPEVEMKMTDLRQKIQSYLDENESTLMKKSQFKGLYIKKRSSHNDNESDSPTSPISEVKSAVTSTATKGRKSVNKVLDKVQSIDAANIPLPDSPMSKIQEAVQEAANNSLNAIQETVQDAANNSMALIQNPPTSLEMTTKIKGVSNALIKFTGEGQQRVQVIVDALRDYLSTPEHIIISAGALELLFLISHVVQFYDHTIVFPPPGGEKGTFATLLHSLFFWLPTMAFTLRTPELRGFSPKADLWPALFWWLFTTVVPPLALSTVLTFSPKKPAGPAGRTRSHDHERSSAISPDPLAYALIRLAILLFPLTSAAPSTFVDSLELSGNSQARALGAGLVAGLMVAEKLRS